MNSYALERQLNGLLGRVEDLEFEVGHLRKMVNRQAVVLKDHGISLEGT